MHVVKTRLEIQDLIFTYPHSSLHLNNALDSRWSGLTLSHSHHAKFNYDVSIALMRVLSKIRINRQITPMPHDFILIN